MKKINTIIRNSLHYLSSNLINFTLGLVSSIILARTLQPNNLGIFHQVQWFTGVISSLLSFGFITCIIKFTAEFKAKNRMDQIGSMIKFIIYSELAITIVSSFFLILFSTKIADHYFSPDESVFFLVSFLAITPGMQTAIFSATLEGAQIFKYQHIHAFTITPLSLLTKIVLMLTGFGVLSLIWCNLAFSLINLVYYFGAVKREKLLPPWFLIKKLEPSSKKEILKYNRSVFSISIIDLIVWTRSENYFLGRYSTAAQVAYYNLAQNLILKFTGVITNLMWRILLPVAAEFEGENNQSYRHLTYYHSIRYSAFILFPMITTCYIGAYELIVIFFGQGYSEVQPCFQILCLGALITSLSQPGSAVIYAANKQGFIFWYGLILAIINIGLNFWLIPKNGAVGAAICFTLVTSMGALGGFYYTYYKLHLKVPFFALVKIAGASVFMGILVYYCLRIDSSHFNFTEPLIHLIQEKLNLNLSLIFGARSLRLLFSFIVGGFSYLTISLLLFKPKSDDLKIFSALEKYLPKKIIQLALWRHREE